MQQQPEVITMPGKRSGAGSSKRTIATILAVILGLVCLTGAGCACSAQQASGDTPDSTPATSTPEPATASEETVTLPPVAVQEQMYREQLASGAQIKDLAENRFASFTFNSVEVTGDEAAIDVTAAYKDGTELNGVLVLMKSEGAWYLKSITRDGNTEAASAAGTVDAAIATAIAEQQAANQEIPEAIVSGAITGMTVNDITTGFGTSSLQVTFTGTGAPVEGTILCAHSKTVDPDGVWFITGFAKS